MSAELCIKAQRPYASHLNQSALCHHEQRCGDQLCYVRGHEHTPWPEFRCDADRGCECREACEESVDLQ